MKKFLFYTIFVSILSTGNLHAIKPDREANVFHPAFLDEEVVLPREFQKTSRFEIYVQGGGAPFDLLAGNWDIDVALVYHFTEIFGWEVISLIYGFPYLTNFSQSMATQFTGSSDININTMQMAALTSFHWSPLYSKLNLFSEVVHFDLFIDAGLGMVRLWNTYLNPTGQYADNYQYKFAVNLAIGLKFMFANRLSLMVSLHDIIYPRELFNKFNIKNEFLILGGIGFAIPAFEL